MTTVHSLLLGALAMGMLTIGLIFLRYWRDGGDRFFLFFALSFFVEGCNRVALAVSIASHEASPWQYGVRFFAYLLIVLAILEKNRVRTTLTEPPAR